MDEAQREEERLEAERLAAEASTRRAEAQARVHEGNQLVAQEKWDEALAAYRAAVEKDPEMSEAWYAIGASEMEENGGTFGGAARVLGFARGGGFFGPVGGHHSAATYGRDVAYKSKASYKSSECQFPILDT